MLELFVAVALNFNPTMVRLIHRIKSRSDTKELNFNPTMVRLIPNMPVEGLEFSDKFQSHYGSINTAEKLRFAYGLGVFQSHYGSINTKMIINYS